MWHFIGNKKYTLQLESLLPCWEKWVCVLFDPLTSPLLGRMPSSSVIFGWIFMLEKNIRSIWSLDRTNVSKFYTLCSWLIYSVYVIIKFDIEYLDELETQKLLFLSVGSQPVTSCVWGEQLDQKCTKAARSLKGTNISAIYVEGTQYQKYLNRYTKKNYWSIYNSG